MNIDCVKDKMGTPEVANTIRDLKAKGVKNTRIGMELAYESYINNALGGTSTQVMNIVSNSFTAMMRVPESFMSVTLSKAYRDPAKRRSYQSAVSEAQGLWLGTMNGFRFLGRRAKNLTVPSEQKVSPDDTLEMLGMPRELSTNTKLESTQRMWASQTWELEGIRANIADVVGGAINAPGNLLNQADVFFKVMNFQGSAYRDLAQRGFANDLSGPGLGRFVQDGFHNMPDEVRAQSIYDAEYHTFTNRPENAIQQLVLSKEFNDAPLLKWVIPFRRTVANVLKYGAERTPLGAIHTAVYGKKEPGWQAVAMAKMITGMSVAGGIMMMTKDNLHGQAPRNRQLRQVWEDSGFKENTIQIGDRYIPLDMLGGFGPILKVFALAKDYMTNTSFAKERDVEMADNKMMEVYWNYMKPVISTMYNDHWVRNMADFTDALATAMQYGDPKSLMYWIERTGVTALPLVGNRSVTREITHRMDPNVQEYLNFGDYMQATIPFVNQEGMTAGKFSIYGDPIVYRDFVGEGWVNEAIDPLDEQGQISQVMRDLDVEISTLRKNVTVSLPSGRTGLLTLENKEWETLQVLAGKGFPGQPTLKETLTKLINSPNFKRRTVYARKRTIEIIVGKYRSNARRFVKNTPDFTVRKRARKMQELELKHLGVSR